MTGTHFGAMAAILDFSRYDNVFCNWSHPKTVIKWPIMNRFQILSIILVAPTEEEAKGPEGP